MRDCMMVLGFGVGTTVLQPRVVCLAGILERRNNRSMGICLWSLGFWLDEVR
ncbi:Protein of unknown function [Pyronema omphalodes CBS 100304]|uniref:Uncharacterized protein n=1 Tax=Pyronema omphalodes (strain CBS 100304) TaxID=1076935 RepID=U4L6H9_PYROM|nr:Protein of unknown function [Pyronema omphalodes CBS 100304]